MWQQTNRWLARIFSLVHSSQKNSGGLWGEQQAELFLRKKGFRILERRFRIGRRDEIDLIARDDETLVFVEVKTRQDESFGRPVAAVNRHKRHCLSRAAVRYISRLKQPPATFRFDVVEVIGSEGNTTPPRIEHITNAFPLDRPYRV